MFNGGADGYITPPYVNASLRGPFGINSKTRFAEVTDGLSQTYFLGESVGGNQANKLRAVGAGNDRVCVPLAPFQGYATVFYDNLMYMGYGRWRHWDQSVIIGGLVARTTDQLGAFYAPNDCGYDSITEMWVPPTPAYHPGQQVPNFRGVHPGIVQFAMGDGSVRSIKTTIDQSAYIGQSTIAGAEIISADSY